jgi:recombination protein RecA
MHPGLYRLKDFPSPLPPPRWSYVQLAGRLVELSGSRATAVLTVAFGLVLEAQEQGDPVAWVSLAESTFFPPDAAEGGVDLDRLPVVLVPDARAAAWAADQLVRSGGFGLVVLDLGGAPGAPARRRIPDPLQHRLVGLAQAHGAAVMVLTEKSAGTPSLGSLVSLRAETRRLPGVAIPAPEAAGFPCTLELRVLKDKRRGPGRIHREVCRGPAGLY